MGRSFAAQQRAFAMVNDGARPWPGKEAGIGEASGVQAVQDDDNPATMPTGSVGTDSLDSAGSKST